VLYNLLRAVAAISLRWFYSRVDAEGLEKIPAGPVLLAVNHPNSLVDSLVVAVACPRRIRFTGRATLFTNPILGAFLRSAGVVPLIRGKDIAALQSEADATRNTKSFDALTNALRDGSAVLIFPEGITGDHVSLAPLKTGAARIAFQALDAGVKHLSIVPIGLTFERKDAPRTRAFMQVGDAIDVAAWPRTGAARSEQSESESDARTLTDELDRRLRAVTLNFETIDQAEQTRALSSELARLMRGVDAIPEVWQSYTPLSDNIAIARRIERLRGQLGAASPEMQHRVDALLRRLAAFRDGLAKRGVMVEDIEISLDATPGVWFTIRETAVALVAGPFALWGWLNHLIPFNAARSLAMRTVETDADPAMNTILNGIVLALFFYAIQGGIVTWAWGAWPGLAYLVSLPIAADVNFYMRARLSRVVRRARSYLRFRRDRELQASLNRELHWLRAESVSVAGLLSQS
jgi:glycerol-3-phosphate O-acyltransferase/dihydroxyacetone phosphate acyltransferase